MSLCGHGGACTCTHCGLPCAVQTGTSYAAHGGHSAQASARRRLVVGRHRSCPHHAPCQFACRAVQNFKPHGTSWRNRASGLHPEIQPAPGASSKWYGVLHVSLASMHGNSWVKQRKKIGFDIVLTFLLVDLILLTKMHVLSLCTACGFLVNNLQGVRLSYSAESATIQQCFSLTTN
jgi:hypothetical protein